ncbi:MAG: IreB family regulatory phosphoprotein [Bacillota bacterium]|nr:MAG: IreB family regulatory phosphoprotein [Bacillota bacterium]
MSIDQPDAEPSSREILQRVYLALQEKGYNPVAQIAGYLLCGDPLYITTHNDARNLIRQMNPQEVMEELVRYYIEGK